MQLLSVGPFASRVRPSRARGRRGNCRAVGTAIGAVALGVAAVGCGGRDPYAPIAYYPTIGTTFTLYPLGRATAPQPSAVDLYSQTPVRPAVVVYSSGAGTTLTSNFDVAFDRDSAGQLVLRPPKQVVSAPTTPRTGFQTSSTPFDSLSAAPGGTYQADSALRVVLGQTIVVQAQGQGGLCSVARPFYAKLVVDSVNAATGALTVRARVDPNCGFRSFAVGIPES